MPLAVSEVHTDEEMIASCDSDTCHAEGGCRHPVLLLLWEALVSLARYSGKGKAPELADPDDSKLGLDDILELYMAAELLPAAFALGPWSIISTSLISMRSDMWA